MFPDRFDVEVLEAVSPAIAARYPQVTARWIEFPAGSVRQPERLPAFLAHPRETISAAPVVVGEEAFGMTAHMQDVACRLAALGYAVIVPDYYGRGDGPDDPGSVTSIVAAVAGLPEARTIQDYQRALDYLQSLAFVRRDRAAVIGFCTGGTHATLMAAFDHRLTAAIPVYMSQPRYHELNDNKPAHPIDLIGFIRCPTLFIYGDKDEAITPEVMEEIRGRMRRHHVAGELRVYPGGGHSFMSDDRPWAYCESAAQAAWRDIAAFLATHMR
ncbi:MAG TPA: dienelactone hydrolase family protein [Candidatus Bathyarchaeia archaeon]|nr:dienelactone hydrolase family protein [Candidatus Bathyarchaeia archaeon]